MATEEEINTQPVDVVGEQTHNESDFVSDSLAPKDVNTDALGIFAQSRKDLPPYDFNSVWLLLAPLLLIGGASATLAILLMF